MTETRRPSIIAHRGLRNKYPENTIASLEAALRIPRISGIEFDVELTKDGKLAVLHQETVAPTSDFLALDIANRDLLRDWVRERPLSEVQRLDAGSWMDARFSEIRVPSLEEVLALPWNSTRAFIELKDATFWNPSRDPLRAAEVVSAAIPLLAKFQAQYSVISFNPEILSRISERFPHTPLVLALWTEWTGRVAEAVKVGKACGASAISLQNSLEVHSYPVSPARDDPQFQLWTAETQYDDWRELARAGVDAIISDFGAETAEYFGASFQ
jgi:glycerophosphoryl diester phosphodiesterase